jgi:hypothetical protein
MIPQEITYKDMKVFIVPILQMGHNEMASVKIYCKRSFFIYCAAV